MSISICIPCYEMHGKGRVFLKKLLDSILTQTFKEFEVVISDQSINGEIENLCSVYKPLMDIKYLKCDTVKGKSSYNLNNSIRNSKFDIIKPMFQDDFFINDACLKMINDNKDKKWGGVVFTHFNELGENPHNTMMPSYNPNIKRGINTFGCPSVSFFKKEDNYFQDNLVWLMDCEFYEKMFLKYGNPYIIDLNAVGIRVWKDSFTYHIPEHIKVKEVDMVRNIHG